MQRSMILAFTTLLVAIASTRQAARGAEAYWPGWLGPNRNGWVEYFTPPAPWPKQLKKAWQVKVGTGYGSPLVAGNRVYLHARQDPDEVVWALELQTGKVRWRKGTPTPFKMGGGGERHGKGPKASPVLADGRVFTLGITGVLSAWDTVTGTLLWRADYGARYKMRQPYWGAATSPIVDGDRVIAHLGTEGDGHLVALQVETGKEAWSLKTAGPCYSSPLLLDIHGIRQVIDWNHEVLAGVESASGRLLWSYPFPHKGHDQNMPTPAYHEGRILLGGENRGVHSLLPQLHNGTWTVKKEWSQEQVALDMSTAVINGDGLYGFSHYGKGRLFCLDPGTGKLLWQGPARTGQNVMFLSIPGHVLALTNHGEVQVIAADRDKSRKVASYTVAADATWAPPVLLADGLLVKDKEMLTRWRF